MVVYPAVCHQSNVVPRAILKRGRRRRISLEVHKIEETRNSYEECIVRILVPASKEELRESLRRAKAKGRNDGDDDGSDEASLSGQSVAFSTMTGLGEGLHGSEADLTTMEGWTVQYRFPVNALSIRGSRKRSLVVEITLGNRSDVREIIFDSVEDAESVSGVIPVFFC
jgi:hypothetical protein